jgi:spermidine synthase
MKFTRALLILCYGLFTIASQTLLFREFLTAFEGNDISVGVFFGSWFLWVGLGALIAYRATRFFEVLSRHTELLLLSYLPAFILELLLILHTRSLAGVEAYGLLPIKTLLLWSMIVNAPVSLITGMLFPVTSRWVETLDDFPIAYVYIFEAAGSFLGGLGVTALLVFGVSLVRNFLLLAVILSASAFLSQLTTIRLKHSSHAGYRKTKRIPLSCVASFVVAGFASICLVCGADKPVTQYMRIFKWTRLLPRDALKGSFQTAQAEYLYGQYQGQWVAIREGSVCETLPDNATSGQTAAVSLCQKPDARRVLVVGSGLGLCRQFLCLPQIEVVDWSNPDGQFVQLVNQFLEPKFQITDKRFGPLSRDIRMLLSQKRGFYDIVIVNLSGANTSVLNRYYTVEFYRLVKSAMRSDDVLVVGVAGGENAMGTELVNLGASVKATLGLVFSKIVLTPGDRSWFIASDSNSLTGDPATLRNRFAAIKGAADIFPSQALLSVYLPDRAAAAMELYSHSDLPPSLLANRDGRPLTYLYGLLVAAKQSGALFGILVQHLIFAGPIVFFIPIAVLLLVQVVSVFKATAGHGTSTFAASFLVFSTGWVGIGASIVLMYLYQTRFGSLYLYIGIISSVFMLGLSIGAGVARRVLRTYAARIAGNPAYLSGLLFAVVAVHLLIMVMIAVSFTGTGVIAGGRTAAFWEPAHGVFAAAFILCGLCSGLYFPIAAQRLTGAGLEAGRAAGKLEMADHFGAAAGSLVTGLLLVPVLGTKMTMFVLVALVLTNLPLWLVAVTKRAVRASFEVAASSLQKAGYALFAIGLTIVMCSNFVAASGARFRQTLPRQEAAALSGQLKIELAKAYLQQTARQFTYFNVSGAQGERAGYIFSSDDLAPQVSGFGGKINLAIYVDADGKLVNFHILQSNETPSYFQLLRSWLERLKGRTLFEPEPFHGIDTVTGATVSSKAVLSAIEESANRFATDVLGRKISPTLTGAAGETKHILDPAVLYLIGIFAVAILVSFWGGFWSRLVVLPGTLVAGGFFLNAQYSVEQIATVLSFHPPSVKVASTFLLVVGVPIVVIFFGNIYCGYICPFGALQELLGYVVPHRFKPAISTGTMRWARFVKYVVLFVLVVVFFLSRNRTTLSAEPLISVFSLHFWQGGSTMMMVGAVVAISLLAALFYERFWCRYLCPVGAFLSLLNSVVVFRRFLPAKRFGKCEFGLTAGDHLDCIHCDRCRYSTPALLQRRPDADRQDTNVQRRGFLAAVVVIAAIISAVSVNRLMEVVPLAAQAAPKSVSAAGEPRDVDQQRIRTMIEQKKLSDKEADFYKKLD